MARTDRPHRHRSPLRTGPSAAARRRPQTRRPCRRTARPALRANGIRDQPTHPQPRRDQQHRDTPPTRTRAGSPPRAGRRVGPTTRRLPKGPLRPRRPRHLSVAVPRRPTRTAHQRLPPRRTTAPDRHPGRTIPLHRTVPVGNRAARRRARPHARHPHQRRRRLATRQQRRLGHLRRRLQPPQSDPRRGRRTSRPDSRVKGIRTVAISDSARADRRQDRCRGVLQRHRESRSPLRPAPATRTRRRGQRDAEAARRDAPPQARQRPLRPPRRDRLPLRIDLRVLHLLRHHHRVPAHPPPPSKPNATTHRTRARSPGRRSSTASSNASTTTRHDGP